MTTLHFFKHSNSPDTRRRRQQRYDLGIKDIGYRIWATPPARHLLVRR